MRQGVRAIVIRDGALLVMYRNKFGDEYCTLVGGGIEDGENAEQALHREVAEETGLTIANPRLVFIEEATDRFGQQQIYLCDYQSGEPALADDSEEAASNAAGQNIYKPMWMPLSELAASRFRSEPIKQHILQAVATGIWPEQPITFQHA